MNGELKSNSMKYIKKECCNINEVVQEYYNYLKHYIATKVDDPVVAEDIVQEVMIKLVDSHRKSVKVTNIKAWLFQVSRNTMYDYFKKNKMTASLDGDWEIEDKSPSGNAKIVESDFIVPMIDLLDEDYALPLRMSDIQKIPQKDIATKLSLSLSATKMRIQRGRNKLKDLFIECCEIEYDKNGKFIGCTIKESCTPLQEIEKNLTDKAL